MSDEAQEIQEATDALYECTAKILEIADRAELVPTGAMLVYQCLAPDGEQVVNYVVSHDLSLTAIVGLAHYVREDATAALFDAEEM